MPQGSERRKNTMRKDTFGRGEERGMNAWDWRMWEYRREREMESWEEVRRTYKHECELEYNWIIKKRVCSQTGITSNSSHLRWQNQGARFGATVWIKLQRNMLNAVVVLLWHLKCTPAATSHAAVHMFQILVNMYSSVYVMWYWQIWHGTGTDFGLQQIVWAAEWSRQQVCFCKSELDWYLPVL